MNRTRTNQIGLQIGVSFNYYLKRAVRNFYMDCLWNCNVAKMDWLAGFDQMQLSDFLIDYPYYRSTNTIERQ